MPKLVQHRRTTRTAQWKRPRFKPFTPTGVTPGATVADRSRSLTGQVWAQAPTRTYGRFWFVVADDDTAHECWERDLVVLGQCIDLPLPASHVA